MLYNNGVYEKYLLACITKDLGDIMCQKLRELNGMSAEHILKKCGQLECVPVDLDIILDKLGVLKYPALFDDIEKSEKKGSISGLVLLHNDDVGIFYKKTDSINDKRFTIAHELAHCCLHGELLKGGYIEFLHNEGFENEHEASASIFAMKLLIPENSLKDIHTKLLLPSLKGLAEIFEVPEHIMKRRLIDLRMAYYLDVEGKLVKPGL